MNKKDQVDISKIDQKKYPRQSVADMGFSAGRSALDLRYVDDPSRYGRNQTLTDADLKGSGLGKLIQELQSLKVKYDKRNEVAYLFKGRTYYEGDTPDYFFAPVRQETDEEYGERVSLAEKQAVKHEESARAQYEQLKKRFG